MDTYNVALFGLIGLVIAIIITGGLISMFEEEPSGLQLAVGGILGAAGGAAAASYDLKGMQVDMSKIMQRAEPEMKMGLPTF
jgi:hypothetical protein